MYYGSPSTAEGALTSNQLRFESCFSHKLNDTCIFPSTQGASIAHSPTQDYHNLFPTRNVALTEFSFSLDSAIWPGHSELGLPIPEHNRGHINCDGWLKDLFAETHPVAGSILSAEAGVTDSLATPSASSDSNYNPRQAYYPTHLISPDTIHASTFTLPALDDTNFQSWNTQRYERRPAVELEPISRKCEYCNKVFPYQRLEDHQRSTRHGGLPTCVPTFPCSKPGEPGCEKVFKDLRDRLRHRKKSCRHTMSETTFKCRCGRTVKRWDQFKKQHSKCNATALSYTHYACDCTPAHEFADFSDLEKHQKSKMGKKGRPRKQ